MLKKGFTLIEILISMALVGVLVAVVTPHIAKVLPDKKKAMFIKAFTRTEMAIANMINDPEMYPTRFDIAAEKGYTLFGLCSNAPVTGLLAKTNSAPNTEYKFHFYYAQELGSSCEGTSTEFSTSDGLKYRIDRGADGDMEDKKATAAKIYVVLPPVETEIGIIDVLNDGTVRCGDDNCTKYLNDRFNLKKER